MTYFNAKKIAPEDIVNEAKNYFRHRYQQDKAKKKSRPSHWLNSTSSCLSHLKAIIKERMLAPYSYRYKLHLSKRELAFLDKLNHSRLEQKLNYHAEIDLKKLIKKLYELLISEEPEDIAIAVAGLTGRRQTEVLFSIDLAPPKVPLAHRYPSFWARVTGFSKTRKNDKYAVRCRELPVLAPRSALCEAISELRELWPSDSHKQASQLYCRKISAAVKRHLAPLGIGRLHDLRRTFVQMSYPLFNERDVVLPGWASRVLGHKSKLSKRIMTYLIVRTTNAPPLNMIFDLAERDDLREDRPEEQSLL